MRIAPIISGLLICSITINAQEKKQITLDDLYKNNTFRIKDVPGFNAMKDGIHYSQKDNDKTNTQINIYRLADGVKEQTLFDNSVIKYNNNVLKIDHYVFSADEKKMLLFTESEYIYRRSALNKVYVYDIANKSIQPLYDAKVLHATFSPTGDKVAFVKDNNLYITDINTHLTTQLTQDGAKNKVINGNCDWVYEEEFSFTKAFEWNSDGTSIAYYKFDESAVPEYAFAKYSGLYPTQYTYKYPKAGERNSLVTIHVYNATTNSTSKVDLGVNTDIYVPRIHWTTSPNVLGVFRLNRLQNELELLLYNSKNNQLSTAYVEKNKYYVAVTDDVHFLSNGHSMIIKNGKDGYEHLYYVDWKNHSNLCLTPGMMDVEKIVGVDEEQKQLYYTAAEVSPSQRNLYVIDLNGKHKKCLTPRRGIHVITPCIGYKYFIDKSSQIDRVPVYSLIDNTGKTIRVLESNEALAKKMDEYDMGSIALTTFKGAKEPLQAWVIYPPHFNKDKKYPVLMYQYSGPGSQEVGDRFPVGNYFWHQMLAQKGYIIVCVDGTGTGYRGENFKKKTYKQLGKLESDDQIAVAKNLGMLPYVDKNRIGIWGWSYGGFMSTTCILKGNDVFKMAIAVAPVTNWRYYDNIYTERYMRTPQENKEGYDSNAPEQMAHLLQGKYLLIHGTADDNVHFQNAAMMVTALVNANKEFDSEYYPDKAHGISGGNTRNHLYKRMTDFVLNNL